MATEPRIALIGIPWDRHSSHLRGPAGAPAKIRDALYAGAMNTCSEREEDIAPYLVSLGDVEIRDDDAHDVPAITAAIQQALDGGLAPLSLGGDHAVTYPILRAVGKTYPGLTILHFDAHPDLYDTFAGDRLSHACPFARIMEEGLARRLVQVGIRTVNPHQRAQARRFGAEIHGCEVDVASLGLEGPLYVSFDLDALDPAFAPGVSHREPGGLSTREALRMLQAVRGSVVGADLVELNPETDLDGVSAVVCAKLLKELADAMVRPVRGTARAAGRSSLAGGSAGSASNRRHGTMVPWSADPVTMNEPMTAQKTLVRRFFEEAINQADLELAAELLAADYVDHPQLPVPSTGFSGFKEFVEMLSTAFPDLHVTIEDMVAEGDKVVVRLSVSGTHKGTFLGRIAPTGKHVTWRGIDIIRVADGRIVERWGERDLLGLMRQLGVLPP